SADLLQLLLADRQSGAHLAEADVDHIVFTGSAAVGRKLAARLGERLISSTLELSGCDAMFVLADADVELSAQAAWFGANLNKGQTCLAVRRVFVDQKVSQRFLNCVESFACSAKPVKLALESQALQANVLIQDAINRGGRMLGRGNHCS